MGNAKTTLKSFFVSISLFLPLTDQHTCFLSVKIRAHSMVEQQKNDRCPQEKHFLCKLAGTYKLLGAFDYHIVHLCSFIRVT